MLGESIGDCLATTSPDARRDVIEIWLGCCVLFVHVESAVDLDHDSPYSVVAQVTARWNKRARERLIYSDGPTRLGKGMGEGIDKRIGGVEGIGADADIGTVK